MNKNKLISIDDSALEQVSGGLGFNFGTDFGRIGSAGASAEIGRGGVSAEAGVKVGRAKVGLGFGFGW